MGDDNFQELQNNNAAEMIKLNAASPPEPTPMELPAKWRADADSEGSGPVDYGHRCGLSIAADELEASIAAHPGVEVADLRTLLNAVEQVFTDAALNQPGDADPTILRNLVSDMEDAFYTLIDNPAVGAATATEAGA